MQQPSRILLLLFTAYLLASVVTSREVESSTMASSVGQQPAAPCALEIQVVLCHEPWDSHSVHERAWQQQCCSEWDKQRPPRTATSTVQPTVTSQDIDTSDRSSTSSTSSTSSSSKAASPLTAMQDTADAVRQLEKASSVAGIASSAEAMRALRPDLDPQGPLTNIQPNYYYGSCTRPAQVAIPVFPSDNKSIQYSKQTVPLRLGKAVIRQTKALAMDSLRSSNFAGYHSLAQGMNDRDSAAVQATYKALRLVDRSSGFVHPGGIIGPAELALMKERLANNGALQELALKSLLTGDMVPPKQFSSSYWMERDTPLDYHGPYPMQTFTARWNGYSSQEAEKDCPKNLPKDIPPWHCAHVALVELDARQAYKQALAFWATGNNKYAQNALKIVEGWSTTNQKFGVAWENGPLEAGWAVASLSRALELLRGRIGGWDNTYQKYKSWVDRVLMPLMDEYWQSSQQSIKKGEQNVLGNWHSTIAEAWMAMGVLTNDRSRYNRAVDLYHATVKDYFRWGKGSYAHTASGWRAIGEASETLRDIYHTQFAMGGLLQVAEMAWQQDDDLYSSNDYALAAALELHAKIILAGDNDEAKLPVGFKLETSMPAPPKGCKWKFDHQRQLWSAVNSGSGKWVSDLKDGVKYLLGIKFLPTGWELGYNHYVGRLGMKLPQTQALIRKYYVDWYEMHFGLGTLSHANTAALLWRNGLKQATVCTQDRESGDRDGTQTENYTPNLSMFHLS